MSRLFHTALILTLLCAAPALAAEPDSILALGEKKYTLCAGCHGTKGDGQLAPGIKMAPSLLNSKIVKADPELAALILFKGIKKRPTSDYGGQVMLPLGATTSDEDVASILTYIRSAFGNLPDTNSLVTPAQIKAWRKKHQSTPQPTRDQLNAKANP